MNYNEAVKAMNEGKKVKYKDDWVWFSKDFLGLISAYGLPVLPSSSNPEKLLSNDWRIVE